MADVAAELFHLYQEQDGCDFKVQSKDGRSFGVHQLILAVRSPVLKTAMTTDMKEKQSGTILFQEFPQDVVDDFLVFLYSDHLPETPKNIEDLMKMGHMYQVPHLVKLAANKLEETLTRDNLEKISSLAEQYEVSSLLDSCAQFFSKIEESLTLEEMEKLPLTMLGRTRILKKKGSMTIASPNKEVATYRATSSGIFKVH